MRIHTHIHKNSPTITPPSLLYFLFPSCFSMLSLSLEKLVTCGVIRSYNLGIQTCRLPALKPSRYFLAAPKAPKPHQYLYLGVQICRVPALKPSRCLFGNPNPAGQGTKTPSIAFSWHSNLPFASPQTLQMPFWQPQPCRPSHKNPINSSILAFKPAVCQPSNHPDAVLAAPIPHAEAPRPHQ